MISRRIHHETMRPDLTADTDRNIKESKAIDARPARIRRHFDVAFKRSAVEHWLGSGKTPKAVAKELGISTWNLRDWKKQFQPEAWTMKIAKVEAENRELRRQFLLLQQQMDIMRHLGHERQGLRRRF